MMISTHSIFTIQACKDTEENIVQIETVITNGLYRFTLLGMQTKYASDTKDRVYSALRSSNLLNLKSDNRKIIVNLSPDNTDKKEGIYDLGIALSLLSCLDKKIPAMQMLALGGLSITGKIIPTKRLKQAVYTAHKHNIQHIVCSKEEMDSIESKYIQKLNNFGIHIIAAETLRELVDCIKHIDKDFVREVSQTNKEGEIIVNPCKVDFNNLDALSRGLLVSLSGGHHTLIQTSITKDIKTIGEEVGNMDLINGFGHEIYTAFTEKLLDHEKISQNTYVENVKLEGKATVESHQKPYRNSVLAFYTPCSCGYQYNFFDTNSSERRCICSKRTILQHRRHIESTYFDLFNIHITNTNQEHDLHEGIYETIKSVRGIQFKRYCEENNLQTKGIFFFPDNTYLNQHRDISKIESILDEEAKELWLQQKYNPSVLRVAQTIQDCLTTKKPTLSKQALVLAISYIPRMDF